MSGYIVRWTVQTQAQAACPRDAAMTALKDYRYNPQTIGQVLVEDESGAHPIAISGFPHFVLTDRQAEVLRWIVLGYDNASIGRELGLTTRAVKAHVAGLLRKIGVRNRVQLAVAAGRLGAHDGPQRDMSRYRAVLETLGPKRKRIAELVTEGLRNREIAAHMRTSEAMVKQYLMQIYNALGVSSRLELANWMLTLERVAATVETSDAAPRHGPVLVSRTRRCPRGRTARRPTASSSKLTPLPWAQNAGNALSGAGR
jgi:DNA-binding NarL/FixJ family response regulator